MGIDPGDELVLRAKYYDWCSAKVADRFLQLSPDEIYELAQLAREETMVAVPDARWPPLFTDAGNAAPRPAAAESHQETARHTWVPPDAATTEATSYRGLVARVSEVLAQQLALPPFDEWRDAYLESPELFEPDLLGLWQDAL